MSTFDEWPVKVWVSFESLFQTLMLFEAVTMLSPAKQIAVGFSGPTSNDESCLQAEIFHLITLASRPDV